MAVGLVISHVVSYLEGALSTAIPRMGKAWGPLFAPAET